MITRSTWYAVLRAGSRYRLAGRRLFDGVLFLRFDATEPAARPRKLVLAAPTLRDLVANGRLRLEEVSPPARRVRR